MSHLGRYFLQSLIHLHRDLDKDAVGINKILLGHVQGYIILRKMLRNDTR